MDLPQPLGPTRTLNSPSAMSRSMSRSAVKCSAEGSRESPAGRSAGRPGARVRAVARALAPRPVRTGKVLPTFSKRIFGVAVVIGSAPGAVSGTVMGVGTFLVTVTVGGALAAPGRGERPNG